MKKSGRRPGNAPVIYEVRLTLDPEIRREFDGWLDGHVREMIALPGFFDARIIRAEPDAEGRLRRIVRYRIRDRKALEHYFEHEAERMRADGLERFGERFRAERDVYAAMPAVGEAGEHRCPNCGAVAEPSFCPVCGQEQRDIHVSFGRMMLDFLGDNFTFDSRFARTLRPLISRPGFLTREYFEGRRARYVPPLRLYLFISILFFALLAFALPSDMKVTGLDSIQPATTTGADGATAGQRPAGPAAMDDDFSLVLFGGEAGPATKRHVRAQLMKISQSPRQFSRYVVENLPIMMFALLPVYTLVLRLLYPLAGYMYLEHMIFSLHVHAFTFLLLGFMLITSSIAARFAPGTSLWPWHLFFWLYLMAYPWIAMRRAYRQGFALTTVKYLLQGLIYFTLLGIALTGIAMAAVYWF